MKKLLIILFLVAGLINAQNIVISGNNSTTTLLGSNASFTGTVEATLNYKYVTVVVRSDMVSATDGVKLKFGKTSTAFETYVLRSYTANDTTTNRYTVPIVGKYFQVKYTNGSSIQTRFSLTTYFHNDESSPIDGAGNIKVSLSNGSGGELFTLTNSAIVASNIATKQGGNNSLTITTETDTINSALMVPSAPLKWYIVSITCYDTDLEFDFRPSFTSPKRIKSGYTLTSMPMLLSQFPIVYVRRKGVSGTVTYDYELYGD